MSKTAKIQVELERMKHTTKYEVKEAHWIGLCDACGGHGAIFYTIEGMEEIDEYGNHSGGIYCPDCKFSNAAKCHPDNWK